MRVLDKKERQARGERKTGYEAGDNSDLSSGARAIVLCPLMRGHRGGRAGSQPSNEALADGTRAGEAQLNEAIGLARAIDLDVGHSGLVRLQKVKPATLFGSGKVEELKGLIYAEHAELVIVDHPLTPVQQRNLEKAWDAKVLDRTGLILEIFGRRARTKEGRLQVEHAHLTYQRSRLVRSWTHLERQRGGYGFLGGPGETQIEADRRVIQDRIAAIRRELETVTRTRGLHRDSRRRVPYPIIALVGYTNAGKSTLFNLLTGAEVGAEDMLFATLDPTMRELRLPKGGRTILSDTVGFISDLPTMLIAAFRATLEEVIEADLILHVRDIAHGDTAAQSAEVETILAELGIDAPTQQAKMLEIWNKIDLLGPEERLAAENRAKRADGRVQCISAATGEGIDGLLAQIEDHIGRHHETLDLVLDGQDGGLANWLHENTEVLERDADETGQLLYRIRITAPKKAALERRLNRTLS